MLPASHYRAYQYFLTLLTEFTRVIVVEKQELNLASLKIEFEQLSQWFQAHVVSLSDRQIELAHASRWQSVQTEILREFKLLSTDMLFLASARQDFTQQKRIKSIKNRLSKLTDYCQIMIKNNN